MTTWRALLALCIALLLSGTGIGLWLLSRARPQPAARRLLLLLFALEFLLGLAYMGRFDSDWSHLGHWLANLNTEYTPGALFSSAQLLLVGFCGLAIALLLNYRDSGSLGRAFPLATGVVFLFLGLDEYLELHENLHEFFRVPTPEALPLGLHTWRVLWFAGGAILALLILGAWRRRFRNLGPIFLLLLIGLALTGLSGIAVEHVALQAFCGISSNSGRWTCDDPERWLLFEELFEIVGVTLVLGALLLFAQRQLAAHAWRRLMRSLPLAGAGALLGLGGYTWALPELELRLTAEPAAIEWLDGALALKGMRIDGSPTVPGERITVWLYWQAREPLPTNLHLSLHALARPELAHSLTSAEEDHIGQYDLEGWLPGLTVRKRITLTMPPDLPTPAAPGLALRVWRGNWARREISGVAISDSDRQLLGLEQALIGSISLPGPPPRHAAITPAQVRFGDLALLEGYTLPSIASAGASLPFTLDWRALAPDGRPYTQFLHLIAADSGEFVTGFDEQPFAARFPTTFWTEGARLQDIWKISLPANMSPGAYHVYFGLYDSHTRERLPLRAGAETLADGLLPLGTLQVQ